MTVIPQYGLWARASLWPVCNYVRNKYRKFEKTRHVQPSVIAVTSTLRRGGIPNSPETSVSVALAEGRCPRLS